ncbi:MAG: hypothetical protein KIT84_19785 [Labilithrix sp.]|nr:hypothetical protein [Labilithrix sp.]MCW5813279.1 hypothetical protein [Labilithrix sp.]
MKRLTALALVAFLGASLAERTAAACAGCSNPNLPTARTAIAYLHPGELSLAFNLTATTMHVTHSEHCPDIGPICNQRDEPAQIHDQRFYVAELRPILALGITDRFALEAQVPLRVVSTTITFRRLDGTAFAPDYQNIHHRDETLYGLGDPWLFGRMTGAVGALAVTARAGVALPVGSTEEDPFARGRAGLEHQHIQFGTGTFAPVFALDAGRSFGSVRAGGYAQAMLFVYENARRYLAGNRYTAGVAGDVEVVKRLRVGLGADVLNEQPERWRRVIQQDGNVGRTDVLAGGMVSYALDTLVLSASIRVPVYQHFIDPGHTHDQDPGQLTYPAIVNLALATTFGGPKVDPRPKSGILPPP